MKNQIFIIEDNIYTFFTTKQILESSFNLKLSIIGCNTDKAIVDHTKNVKSANILRRPQGNIKELIQLLKKKKVNRLNTEIIMLITDEVSLENAVKMQPYISKSAA